jgi:hypothetical protein
MDPSDPHVSLTQLITDGRRPLFVAGLLAGLGVLAWLAISPRLLGGALWWPFDPRDLVQHLEFDAIRLRLTEAQLTSWWLGALAIALGGFVVTWLTRRRQHVLSHLELLQQLRRVEHHTAVAHTDALWAAFEAAQYDADDAHQLALLEQYAEAAAHADLTSHIRANRVAHCRDLARELTDREPQRALRLLQLAARLDRTGTGHAPALPRVLAADAIAFLAGAAATLTTLPAATLAVLLVVGVIVFVFKAVITILQLIFAIFVVAAILGAIASK